MTCRNSANGGNLFTNALESGTSVRGVYNLSFVE